MSSPLEHILIDTSAFVTAKDTYYGFDICPGFWTFIRNGFSNGTLMSIRHVWNELERVDDQLSDWMHENFKADAFYDCLNDAAVYDKQIFEVTRSVKEGHYRESAKNDFLNVDSADPWLVAFCLTHGGAIVTEEKSRRGEYRVGRPYPKELWKKVSLVDICDDLRIPHMTPWELLREQGAQLLYQPSE